MLYPLLKSFFWAGRLSLAREVLFLLLTSFTDCRTNRDCLFSSEFLISFICFWMSSSCFFFFGMSSLEFVKFLLMVVFCFLLLRKDTLKTVFRFSLIVFFFDSVEILYLAYCLVGMHLEVASK